MTSEDGRDGDRWQVFFWRRPDQQVLGASVLVCLSGLGVWWAVAAGWRGGLVEYDTLPHDPPQFLVDVNSAPWPELAQLPGIGETLARRIVESRQVEGPFQRVEDLQRVRGIGPKTVERIAPFVAPPGEPTYSTRNGSTR